MTLLGLLRRTQPTSTRLADVLAGLSIEPFDRESVERYKKEKQDRTASQIPMQVFPMGSWINKNCEEWKSRGLARDLTGDEKMILELANGFDVSFWYDRHSRHIPLAVYLRWRRMSIAEAVATIGVPDYVAHKANQILEKAPDAVIEVDALESRNRSYDPFLVVKLGEEEHYVEAWGDDDREFQRDVAC